MEHTTHELKEKLLSLHPSLNQYDVKLDLEFKGDKDYWVVKMEKDDHKLHTHLDPKDANACLDDVQCVYLEVQVDQFVDNFKRLADK